MVQPLNTGYISACSKFVRQCLCFQKSHHTSWLIL